MRDSVQHISQWSFLKMVPKRHFTLSSLLVVVDIMAAVVCDWQGSR